MRRIVSLTGIAGALALAACSGKSSTNDDFKKDLERASTASEITLPTAQSAQQVVSAIERTTPPAPRRVANSQRIAKHKPAPTRTPEPVEAQGAEVTNEVETAPAEPAPRPQEQATLPSPRPQPVAQAGTGGGDGSMGRGRGDIGSGIGTVIGVVLRGGVVDGDDCDPRSEGRGRGGIAINNRIPVGVGTFPGSGRIGTAVGGAVLGGIINSTMGGGRRRF